MPHKDYTDRQLSLIFPSHADRERWRDIAIAQKMTLTKWIYEMVEGRLAEESEPAQEIASQRTSLKAENRKLKRDLEKEDARLRELETEIFKLQHANLLNNIGLRDYSIKVIEVLRSGGLWPNRELLVELGVNPDDAYAIQIVTNQLQALQDFGLVKESARGWRWIG